MCCMRRCFYKDKVVAVVGGGNSAIINAITLADLCNKVYVIQNLDKLSAEANLEGVFTAGDCRSKRIR